MLARLRSFPKPLSAANARIAQFVLAQPEAAVQLSVGEVAQRSGVSEPTVIRFCRHLGCEGYRDFRQALLRELAETPLPATRVIGPDDTIEEACDKVFASTVAALDHMQKTLPKEAIRHAATAILKARWVHIFGFGASATVAADAQHKLYRLAAMVVAYGDAHMQAMAASTLGPEDVLIAISSSGATGELIETVRLAHENKVTIIALTRRGSPLAGLASIVIPIELDEPRVIFTPATMRIAQLAVIDALVVGVSLLSPPTIVAERFARMDAAIRRRRLPTSPNGAN